MSNGSLFRFAFSRTSVTVLLALICAAILNALRIL